MILTVSLNPAVDKNCRIDRVILGQVNRILEFHNSAGGKGINVTRVLRQLKMDVNATGFLGGYSGMFIQDELERMKAKYAFTQIAKETRSNTNIISADGYVTEILEPGPEISEQESINFLEQFSALVNESEIIVISGSMAKGLSEDYYVQLIEICHNAGKKVLLDTSGEPFKRAIEAKPYLIKPNRREFEYVTGCKLDSEEKVIEKAKEFVNNGIEIVIISNGAKGFLAITKENVYRVVPPAVKAVNTVGCGDSMVAALTEGICKELPLEEMLVNAAAISAANTLTWESGTITMENVRKLKENVEIFKVC